MTDINKMTHRHLNKAIDLLNQPNGWNKMNLDAKRAFRAAMDEGHKAGPPMMEPGATPEAAAVKAMDAAPEGATTIKMISGQSNPVPLYVYGRGSWLLYEGETYTLPSEALDALRNSDVVFEKA